jgi:fructose-1-phosphate kinase PfkB-like protein
MNIWITGFNLSIDTVVKIESRDKYERLHAKQWKSVGSKGANVLRSLTALGQCPHLIGLTWGTTGLFIQQLMQTICPNPLHLHILHHPSGESRINIIKIEESSEVLISAESPEANKELFEKHIKHIASLISREDILVLTGSFPKGLEIKDLIPLFSKLPENHIWIDLKGQYLIDAYKYIPDGIFKVNHIESHDLTSRGILPNILIVTSATRTIAYINGKHLVVNIPEVTPVNTVGAGDVFMASLIYEKLILGKDWETALRKSAARATASTLTLGVSEWNESTAMETLKSITVFHSS